MSVVNDLCDDMITVATINCPLRAPVTILNHRQLIIATVINHTIAQAINRYQS